MAETQTKPAETQTQAAEALERSEFDRLLAGSCTFRPFAESQDIKLSPGIILKLLVKPTRSGALPDQQQLMKFQVLCRSQGLNPFTGDCYLIGYDGKFGPEWSIVTAIGALYKRAEANPQYDGIESGVIVKTAEGYIVERAGDFMQPGDKLLGAWAMVHRKDQACPTSEKLNIEARNKNHGRWNDDAGGMIVKCAEAGALRRAFPSQLSAMFIPGEMATGEMTAPATPATRSIEDQIGDYCQRTGRSTAAAVSFYRGWRAVNPASDGEAFLTQLTKGKFDWFIPAIPARETPVETPEPAPVADPEPDADTITDGNLMVAVEAEAAAQNVDPATFYAYIAKWMAANHGATNRADLARELLEAVRDKKIDWGANINLKETL